MTSERLCSGLAVLGGLAVLAAATAHQFKLDLPEYALSIAENPVDIYADYGVTSGPHLSQQFNLVVTNGGRKEIGIESVRASCSCTVAGRIPADPIPPGGSIEIPLQVQLPTYGSKSTSLTLTSDNS